MRNVYKILVSKPEMKRLLVRPRLRWEDNIKMDIKKRICTESIWLLVGSSSGFF
jgi:hypothetical protein